MKYSGWWSGLNHGGATIDLQSVQFFKSNITMDAESEADEVSWSEYIWAVTCDFQQFGILTSVDSDAPVQPSFKLRNSELSSVSTLTIIENSSD